MRRLRRISSIILFSLAVLFGVSGGLHFSPLDLAVAPYRYDLVGWEIAHFPDKWVHKLKSFFSWDSATREEKLGDLREYFRLGIDIRAFERDLADLYTRSSHEPGERRSLESASRTSMIESLSERLDDLRGKRSGIKAGVEETLESEVSAVLAEEGFSSRIGLIFPPVDVALASPPRVLVVSPRDRIHRLETALLKPDMALEEMEALEDRVLQEQDLAALVVAIGGVATYPTIVRDDSSMRRAAELAVHEWLHAYWFFRPLGWNMFDSPEMNTLSETAATLAGRELGIRVYEAIMGEKIRPPQPASPPPDVIDEEAAFDFREEMRKTRLEVDSLLAQGRVEDAEAYMEERRLVFLHNGFYIRKLNQAYFAFYGTYAASPASVSPIGAEVERLRNATASVGDFIRIMAGFGSYREFQLYLTAVPASAPGAPEQQRDELFVGY